MKVYVCAPREKTVKHSKKENTLLAKFACHKIVEGGDIPYAPSLYFDQFLNSKDKTEQTIKMGLEFAWLHECDELCICSYKEESVEQVNITSSMAREIEGAHKMEKKVRILMLEEASTTEDIEKKEGKTCD